MAMQKCSRGQKCVHVVGPPVMTRGRSLLFLTWAFYPTEEACRLAGGLTFQTCLPTTSGSQNQLRLLVSVTDNAWAVCTCPAKRLPESATGSALRIKSSQISVRMGPVQNATSLCSAHSKARWGSAVPLWSVSQVKQHFNSMSSMHC